MARRNDHVSVAEAAKKLGCDRGTIYGWISRGKLEARKHNGVKTVSLGVATKLKSQRGRKKKAKRGPGRGSRKGVATTGDPMTISEFAAHVGVAPRTVTNWKRKGRITCCDAETADRMREQMSGREQTAGRPEAKSTTAMNAAKLRRANAEADLWELKLKRQRDELYDAAVVDGVIRRLAGTARAEFQRCAREVPGLALAEVPGLDPAVRAEVESRIRAAANAMIRESLRRLNEIAASFEGADG